MPFDIPEAETEIVAGTFTEYSGRLLGLFRFSIDIEAIVGSALVAAVYLPFGLDMGFALSFPIFILKILFIISILALSRTLFARLRIDQMVEFCWKYVSPFAFLQIVICLVLKGVLAR